MRCISADLMEMLFMLVKEKLIGTNIAIVGVVMSMELNKMHFQGIVFDVAVKRVKTKYDAILLENHYIQKIQT